MVFYEEIEELADEFEKRAKKLGYTLEALILVDRRDERLQINWNEKAKRKEAELTAEALAIALWKMCDEDADRVNDAIKTGYFRTKKGARELMEKLAPQIEEAFKMGIELGNQILKDARKEVTEEIDEKIKLEEAEE